MQTFEQPTATMMVRTTKPKSILGIRHMHVGLVFMSMAISFTMWVNLSVAIVAMVDKKNANPDFPEYNWSEQTQSVILSGLGWGFFILQIPAGYVADKSGPKLLIAFSLFVTSLFSILTPVAASTGGWGLVFACRFIQGLAQGIMQTVLQVLLARWIPVEERGTLASLAFTGTPLGTALGLIICGQLATSSAGWPSCFYVFGGLGLVWSVLWLWLGANSPAEDRFISAEERAYIADSLRTNEQQQSFKTPWKAIMTSWPVWAINFAAIGWSWGFYTLITEIPTFMKTILGYDLNANGFLSSLPYLANVLLYAVLAVVSQYLNTRQIISVVFSRKLFTSIGFLIPAVALIVLAYSRDVTLSVVLLVISVGVNSAATFGFVINHIDVAPHHAGTIFGISNSLACLISCFAPLVVGAIVTESGSVAQWQIVFFIAAGVYFFAGVFYVLFAQSKSQKWNNQDIPETSPLSERL